MTPNKEFSQEFRDIFNHLNLKSNYSVIHFRLGDKELIENKLNDLYSKALIYTIITKKKINYLFQIVWIEKQLKEKFVLINMK